MQQHSFEMVSSAIERLDIDELQTMLRSMRAVQEVLNEAVGASQNPHLLDARDALAGAIESGQRALHFSKAGKTKLGIYLLHVENGLPENSPAPAGKSLVPSRAPRGGGIPDNLDVSVIRTERLPPLMDESRAVVWVQVGHSNMVPLLKSGDNRAFKGYADNWQRFHDAGMPVPPLYLRGNDGGLLIPELKQDGSEIYGSGMARDVYRRYPRERPRPEIDPHFLRLTNAENFSNIEKAALDYMHRATEHSLQLSFHDPFQLVVHPDGSWELAMRDLRTAKDISQYPHLYTPEELAARNEQCTALWLVRLQILRRYLAGEPSGLGSEHLRFLLDVETGQTGPAPLQ